MAGFDSFQGPQRDDFYISEYANDSARVDWLSDLSPPPVGWPNLVADSFEKYTSHLLPTGSLVKNDG